MAKERTSSAFKGLLRGVDFVRNLQKDQEEEQRYQDQVDFRNNEFDWRKAQAKVKANQWRKEFGEQVREFNKGQDNADRTYALANKKASDLNDYYDATTDIQRARLGIATKQYDEAYKANKEQRILSGLLNEVTRSSQTPMELTKEQVNSMTISPTVGLSGPAMLGSKVLDIFGLNPITKEHEAKVEKTTQQLNATNFTTSLVTKQLPVIEKVLNAAKDMEYGDSILKQSPELNQVAAQVQKAMKYVQDGYIKDPKIINKIKKLSVMILPYKGAIESPSERELRRKAEYDIQKQLNVYEGKKQIDKTYEE